ncbi:hypothetical protein [Nocardia salmonicida]|uniref:hypothetical protein n=1 Tax=Nocardia salmonicida TaxID=53431 RepID=UPI003446037E
MKWDGVRAIAHCTPTGISLWSRNLRERNNAGIMPMGCFVDEGDLVIDAIVNVNGVLDVGLLGDRGGWASRARVCSGSCATMAKG